MLLPFLGLLIAGILLVGWATGVRTGVASKARDAAFALRPKADPGQPLKIDHNPLDSKVEYRARGAFKGGSVFPAKTFQSESAGFVTARTWDSASVPFNRGQGTFQPHSAPLGLVLGNVPLLSKVSGPVLFGFRFMEPGGGGPATDFTRGLGKVARVATQVAMIGLTVPEYTAYYPIMIYFYGQAVAFAAEAAAAAISFDFPGAAALAAKAYAMYKLGRFMQLGIESIDNLREASFGHAGNWDSDMPGRIDEVSP
jgi:hypothetical protein